MNGRVTSHLNNFTSVTGYKGKAVVDYHITRQSDLKSVQQFKVLSMTDLISELGLQQYICDGNKPPDHSLLSMTVELSSMLNNLLLQGGNTLGCKTYRQKPKYFRKVGEQYMSSEVAVHMLPILMSELEECTAEQTDINDSYENWASFILEEVACSMGSKNRSR